MHGNNNVLRGESTSSAYRHFIGCEIGAGARHNEIANAEKTFFSGSTYQNDYNGRIGFLRCHFGGSFYQNTCNGDLTQSINNNLVITGDCYSNEFTYPLTDCNFRFFANNKIKNYIQRCSGEYINNNVFEGATGYCYMQKVTNKTLNLDILASTASKDIVTAFESSTFPKEYIRYADSSGGVRLHQLT